MQFSTTLLRKFASMEFPDTSSPSIWPWIAGMKTTARRDDVNDAEEMAANLFC